MKHILWLFANSLKCLSNGDIPGFREAWILIYIHIRYSGERIR